MSICLGAYIAAWRLGSKIVETRYRNVVLYRNVFLSRSLCMDVFQEEITFQKMGSGFSGGYFF